MQIFFLIFYVLFASEGGGQKGSSPAAAETQIEPARAAPPTGTQIVAAQGQEVVLPSGTKIIANKPIQLGGLMGVPPGDLQDLRIAHRGASVPLKSQAFLKYYEDAKCDDPVIFKTRVAGFSECKENCIHRYNCRFFTFWTARNKPKFCELYETCMYPVSQDKDLAAAVYKRLNECEMEIGYGSGAYPTAIKNAFPDGIIRLHAPNKNFHCRCTTRSWMICVIFLPPGSQEERVVMAKFNRADPMNMRPFYIMPSVIDPDRAPVVFDKEGPPGTVKIYAEIEPALPDFCIHITICTDGTPGKKCPYLEIPFISGDPVYILKSDREIVAQLKAVPCVSITGLRRIALEDETIARGGFEDPFGRAKTENGPLFLAKRDYDMYWLFDEKAIKEGICQKDFTAQAAQPPADEPPAHADTKKKPAKKKKKKKSRDSPGPGSSSMSSGPESSDFGEDESPRMDTGLMGPAGSIPEERPEHEDLGPASASQPVSPKRGRSPITVPGKPKAAVPASPTKAPTKAGSSGSGSLQLEDNEKQSSPDKSSSDDLTFESNEDAPQVEQAPMLASRSFQPLSPREAERLPPRKAPPDAGALNQQMATMGMQSNLMAPASAEKSSKGKKTGSSSKYPTVGAEVMLAGLQSQPDLNGQRGPIVSVYPEKGRVAVKKEDLISQPAEMKGYFLTITSALIFSIFVWHLCKAKKAADDVYVEFRPAQDI